jgi:SDR family mycofactocin-dependent oxidoreductase
MGLLDGKVVMITGGSRGQGRAHALVSAGEGADIVIMDVTEDASPQPTVAYDLATAEDMATTVKEVQALGRRIVAVPGDVRAQSDVDAAVAEAVSSLGQIDVLIANAGIFSLAPFWEITEQTWEEMISVNLSGVWRSAKAVAPHMIERRSGSIVMISSVNGLEAGPNFAHYTAAKHGVVGLMKTVALELAPHGVRCNAVHPGAVRSGMTDNQAAWDMYAGQPGGGTIEHLIAAGRHYGALRGTTFMPAETIANAALFLNSDLARTITGVSLPVEAGHLLMPGVNAAPVD